MTKSTPDSGASHYVRLLDQLTTNFLDDRISLDLYLRGLRAIVKNLEKL